VTDEQEHADMHCYAFISTAICVLETHKINPNLVAGWKEDILAVIHDVVDELGEIQ
jgi:hypothetical protein